MTITTRKPLTAQERLDRHNAYHVSGMMERGCQSCTETLIRSICPVDYKEYFSGGKGK